MNDTLLFHLLMCGLILATTAVALELRRISYALEDANEITKRREGPIPTRPDIGKVTR